MQPADKRGILYNELVGGGLAGSKVWVDDFNPLWGEFLLDLGEPVHDVQDYRPLVTRMEGYGLDQGRVKYRSLQQIQFPWGIDGSLPVQIWANELFRDDHRLPFDPTGMNRLDLQWECRRRELSTKGKRSVLIQRINNIELSRGRPEADKAATEEAVRRLDSVTLPLHRVLRNLPAVPKSRELPFKQPPFRAGEVVLVYGTLASDANICLVRDYEGNRGRLGREDLDEIELAFGLKLNRRALVEILDRLAWPDEEDAEPKPITNNPELQAEHVQRYTPQWTDAANAEAEARRQREKESEQRFEDEIAADNVSDVASDKAAEKEQERKRKEAAAAAKAAVMKRGGGSGVTGWAQVTEAEMKRIRAAAKANVAAWAAGKGGPEDAAAAAEKRKAGIIADIVASMQHPGGPKRPPPGGGGQGGTSKKPKI